MAHTASCSSHLRLEHRVDSSADEQFGSVQNLGILRTNLCIQRGVDVDACP